MILEELVQHLRKDLAILVQPGVSAYSSVSIIQSLSMPQQVNDPLWTNVDIHNKGADLLLYIPSYLIDLKLNSCIGTYLPILMVFMYWSPSVFCMGS